MSSLGVSESRVNDPVLVWGAGAIGGTIGAALVRAGEDVLFVDTDADHVAAMNARGLTVTGEVDPHHVAARAATPEAVRGTFGRVLLAVKAHHTEAATKALLPHLAPDGLVASFQNGLNEHTITALAERERTIGAFVNYGADYIEPGVIHYGGRGAVVVGELDGRRSERVEALHRALLGFDRDAVLTGNIFGYLWSKLIYGAQLFATALTNDSIADVLADAKARPVLTALAHEVVAVARAEGVRLEAFNGFDPAAFLPGAAPADTAASFDAMVAHNRRSAKSHSGIWRDLAVRKRKTEVDAQVGPVAAIGARHGIPTPLASRLIALIHEIEDGRRPLGREALATLAAAVPA